MAEGMGVRASSLKPLLDQHPSLLSIYPSQPTNTKQSEASAIQLRKIISRLRHLSQSLSVPMELVIKMAAQQPGVLSAPPSMIQERAADIEQRLSLPPGSVLPLLCHQPEFLEMSPERLVGRTLQLGVAIEASPLDILKSLARLHPPSSLLSVMGKRSSSISLRVAQMNALLQAPGFTGPIPIPDDPTLNEDGSIRFTPLLMRNPLPGAIEAFPIPPREMHEVRRNLKRAAHVIETGSKAAGRLLPPSTYDASGIKRSRLASSIFVTLKCPNLFLIPMETIASSHQMLLNLLKVPHARLSSLLVRCPVLLALPSQQIKDSWSCLNQELISETRHSQQSKAKEKASTSALVARRVLQQPQILSLSADEIRSRMRSLSEDLGWTPESTRRAVWNQCQLLGMSSETIRSKVEWLAHLTSKGASEVMPLGHVSATGLVLRQPALLTLSISTLSRNLEGLKAVLQPPLHSTPVSVCLRSVIDVIEAEPTLLTQPPRTLSEKMERLGRILSLPSPLPIVLEHPVLLSIPTANLKFKIQELEMIHDCSKREAIKRLMRNPSEVLFGRHRSGIDQASN